MNPLYYLKSTYHVIVKYKNNDFEIQGELLLQQRRSFIFEISELWSTFSVLQTSVKNVLHFVFVFLFPFPMILFLIYSIVWSLIVYKCMWSSSSWIHHLEDVIIILLNDWYMIHSFWDYFIIEWILMHFDEVNDFLFVHLCNSYSLNKIQEQSLVDHHS